LTTLLGLLKNNKTKKQLKTQNN